MSGRGWTPLFASLVTSSVWRTEPDHVRIAWVTMLAMADSRDVFESSIPGLADFARITIEQAEDAIRRLSDPDKYSRTEEYEGRRIEKVDGGWHILNRAKFRDKLGQGSLPDEASMKPSAVRMRRLRERQKGDGDVEPSQPSQPSQSVTERHTGVTVSTSPSPVFDPEKEDQKQKPVGREIDWLPADWLTAFGRFQESIVGLVRSASSPFAVTQTLQMHLDGELGHEKATPEQLGLAVQQYIAGGLSDGGRFNARHFAGYVRAAKKSVEIGVNRQRNGSEEQAILREQAEKERAVVEEREADGLVRVFRTTNPEKYAEYERRANAQVPPGMTFGRETMIRSAIATMIRQASRHERGGAS